MNRTKTACVIFGNGCPRAFLEASWVVKFLISNGWKITSTINKASLVFFYACGFNADAEKEGLKNLQLANKLKNKESSIIACGCLPGINKNISSNGLCDYGITRGSIDQIDEIVASEISIKNIKEPNDLTPYQFIRNWNQPSKKDILHEKLLKLLKKVKRKNIYYFYFLLQRKWALINKAYNECHLKNLLVGSSQNVKDEKTLFQIKTSTGCLSECSYCAIRHATGPLISKSLERITNEFNEGLSKGYKSFFLSGEDVGAYGQDIGLSIVDLLNSLFNFDEKYELEIHDFSPKWLIEYFPYLSQIMKNNHDRIGLLGIPVQSGSEKILKLMKRDYSASALKNCLISLRQTIPNIKLMTHVMIGFPGEDENDFGKTIDLLDSVKFDLVHIFRYSDRTGTKAAELNNKISDIVKDHRIHKLKNHLIKHIPQTTIFG